MGNDPVNAVGVLGMFITGVGYNRPNWWQTPPDTRTEYEKALDAIKELELAEWMTWQTIDMLAGEEGDKALMEGKVFFGVVIFGKDFVIGQVTKIFRLGKGLANKAYEFCCTNIRAKLSKVKAFLVEKTGNKRLCSNASTKPVVPIKPGGAVDEDFISEHSKKHQFDSTRTSTKNRSQFGQDVDVAEVRRQTMSNPDNAFSDVRSRITKYEKEFDGNLSTPDTPTPHSRVFINNEKPDRSTQFPYVPRKSN